jgi:predicted nucleotide-binding protein (sugar kinase/HSP70/actin superfamily)
MEQPTGIDIANLFTSRGAETEDVPGYDAIEAELKAFEAEERKRLGLDEEKVEQWRDPNPQVFTRRQRETTTLLLGGLTRAQDFLIAGALAGVGYKVKSMDVPDYEALRFGKEFGNRGQCNPTYFTVGNLVKYLTKLRDEEKIPVQEIVEKNIFMTAGACGPCRFGTYVTEYRKALRDAGFDGFRVMLFQQQGGLKQATGEDPGLEFNPAFFRSLIRAIMAGDVLNAVGYRIRPYEVNPGETNKVLEECKKILHEKLEKGKGVVGALLKCRKLLSKIPVDRLRAKPKVSIIGEFWAMTTEGDGNYQLQKFLESEGAEVDIQLVTAWLLYNIWEHTHDTKRRMTMARQDSAGMGLEGKDPRKKLAILWVAEKAVKSIFAVYAKAIGLEGYHLPNMDEIATISHQYYDNHLRGGEGHMEVGKLLQTVQHKKAHMVVSVKPFGCMPSSGVSDGVQSLVVARYPEAIFTAIETTGDGEVNVQSRIQMDLFKARQKAEAEYKAAVEKTGLSEEKLRARAAKKGSVKALHYPKHEVAGTAANQVLEIIGG